MSTVSDLDTLTFTRAQVKELLLNYWCMKPPDSVERGRQLVDMLVDMELNQQTIEKRFWSFAMKRLPAPR